METEWLVLSRKPNGWSAWQAFEMEGEVNSRVREGEERSFLSPRPSATFALFARPKSPFSCL